MTTTIALLLLILTALIPTPLSCFQPIQTSRRRTVIPSTISIQSSSPFSPAARRPELIWLSSSRGGLPEPEDRDDNDDDEIKKFLDPNFQESENLQRAREYLSDNALPMTHDLNMDMDISMENDTNVDDMSSKKEKADSEVMAQEKEDKHVLPQTTPSEEVLSPPSSGALVKSVSSEATSSSSSSSELDASTMLERNPYMAVISRLSPSELISRFTSTAHPRVQSAVRQTILGMLGGLPKLAFETTTFTTAQRLASLMFQLQMTGYMFKNAEYRLSLQQSLGDYSINSQYLLQGENDDDEDDDHKKKVDLLDPRKTKVRGKLRIPLGDVTTTSSSSSSNATTSASPPPPKALEVDAAAYMGELRQEVAQLRRELTTARAAKEEALRKDLLLYIRTLPEQELRSLTNTMSPDVLVAMKGLVNAVLTGIGEEAASQKEQFTPQTITEQSGEALAQLCMWQLAIGYNLRTLEVREEMKKSIAASAGDDGSSVSSSSSSSGSANDDDDTGSVETSSAFE